MALAQIKDYDRGVVLGSFVERERGKRFEFLDRGADYVGICSDFPHLVCVADVVGWPYRFARVLQTVAYVVTDEAADGSPIVQRWEIKSRRDYAQR